MVTKKIYILAGILTLLVVLSTIGVSMILDSLRKNYVRSEIEELRRDTETLNIESIMLESVGNLFTCEKFSNTTPLSDIFKRLVELENKIKYYEDEDILFKSPEAVAIKEDYILMCVRTWFILHTIQNKCEKVDYINVLYIYELEDCEDCERQGIVLSYYKKQLNEKFLVFPMDGGFDAPIVEFVKELYDYEEAPMVIIDGVPYKEFVSKEQLGKLICSKIDAEFCIKE